MCKHKSTSLLSQLVQSTVQGITEEQYILETKLHTCIMLVMHACLLVIIFMKPYKNVYKSVPLLLIDYTLFICMMYLIILCLLLNNPLYCRVSEL